MKSRYSDKKAFLIIALLCACSCALVSIQFYYYWRSRIGSERSADMIVRTETQAAVDNIETEAKKIEAVVKSLASYAEKAGLSESDIAAKLKEAHSENPQLYDIGVAKEAPATPGRWTEPFRSDTSKDLVVAFSMPFHSQGSSGAAYASVSLKTIRQFAGSLKFGDTGYCYLLSKSGKFIYHPIKEAAESQKTIFEIARGGKGVSKDKDFMDTAKKAIAGGTVSLDVTNPSTGQRFRLSYKAIPATGWALGAVFFADEIFTREDVFRKEKMWTALGLIIFITLAMALVFKAYEVSEVGLWAVSAIFSIICIAGSFYIWHLALAAPLVEENKKMVFTDAPSLNRFVDEHSRSLVKANRIVPAYIPTGIYIQSLEFMNANDLNVTGYVWQKYQDRIHDHLERGFNLPEARSIESSEVYRRKIGNTEVIGWHFEAVIREKFDYSKYPFDRPDIYIWLKHKDPTSNVVLVPDLSGYRFITPSAMPGLQDDLAFPGYVFLGAFFDYDYEIRRTNLGISTDDQSDRIPEFYYNIIVKRNFITPFVSRLFPLFIMFAILFVVQLMFSQDEEKKRAFGLNAFAVMGVVITFFFSTLLSHNSLRQELNADTIIFIENFHFIAYFMLLLVTIKTLLFIGNKNIRFVQYKQGLIPKLLYWPLFTGLVYAVSFINFYK